ncbi:MAG TPA: class I SAM-dependent methyltransferase [Candidatus Nanoarchaeia archaeon]|nr:class I SAM-dependent methyltransferase [Candidatus Nanoarchaeia archaeon]
MGKVLFDTSLNKKNIAQRDFFLNKIKRYKQPATSTVLEVGIGNGRFVILLADHFREYWGIDNDSEYINAAKANTKEIRNLHLQLGKAESIPFKQRFDIILFINSWHFTDNEKALGEVKKAIKKDGIVFISEPTKDSKFAASVLQKEHPDFDEKKFNLKLKRLEKAASFLEEQNYFEIVEEGMQNDTNSRYWILKQK